MGTINQAISEIIQEFTRLCNSPIPPPTPKDSFPTMLPAGNGGSIIISRDIERKILYVGKIINENKKLGGRFGKEEWDSAVRVAFGEALIKINPKKAPTENAVLIQRSISKTLRKREIDSIRFYEHAFGCTLFEDDNISPINIGSVRFEDRKDWLKRKKTARQISTVTYNRVCRSWEGKKLKVRKASNDSSLEQGIIDAIKSCRFVCSVETEGLAHQMSQEKAHIAARIALASIALMWQQPTKALEQFNLLIDRPSHIQTNLTFTSGNQLLFGYKRNGSDRGLYLKNNEWKVYFEKYKDIFCVINEVLEFYLKPIKKTTKPNIMSSLFHALLWFSEGCREKTMPLAIVKYASALDALACGKKNKGIQNIVETCLGIKQHEKLFKGNEDAMHQIIKNIYDVARSQTLHGTKSKISEDWSEARGQAEYLTRLCLLTYLKWAYLNPRCDDPALFQQTQHKS